MRCGSRPASSVRRSAPLAGGILTEVLGWESIFLVQVPLALVPLVALRGLQIETERKSAGRPALTANAAVLLLSGGLVAALFLLVLLLVEGWGMSPAAAGLVVTVMPLAALLAARLAPRSGRPTVWIAAGIVLVGGGLPASPFFRGRGGHGRSPRSSWSAAGIGLALAVLTERAVASREEPVVHGAWTLAARHAGVVLGLLLLTPVLTDCARSQRGRGGAGGRGGGPRQRHPGPRQAASGAGRPGRSPQGGRRRRASRTSPPRSRSGPTTRSTSRCSRHFATSWSGRSRTRSPAPSCLRPLSRSSALLPAVLMRDTPT